MLLDELVWAEWDWAEFFGYEASQIQGTTTRLYLYRLDEQYTIQERSFSGVLRKEWREIGPLEAQCVLFEFLERDRAAG